MAVYCITFSKNYLTSINIPIVIAKSTLHSFSNRTAGIFSKKNLCWDDRLTFIKRCIKFALKY